MPSAPEFPKPDGGQSKPDIVARKPVITSAKRGLKGVSAGPTKTRKISTVVGLVTMGVAGMALVAVVEYYRGCREIGVDGQVHCSYHGWRSSSSGGRSFFSWGSGFSGNRYSTSMSSYGGGSSASSSSSSSSSHAASFGGFGGHGGGGG